MNKKTKQSLAVLSVIALSVAILVFIFGNATSQQDTGNDKPDSAVTPKQLTISEKGSMFGSSLAQRSAYMASQDNTVRAESNLEATVQHMTDYDASADYTYSSPILADAITGLKGLNKQRKQHATISEADVAAVWKQVDAAVAENYMSPVEGIKHKQWLASLVASDELDSRLEGEINTVQNALKEQADTDQAAHNADPKFIAYKAEEKRLTAQIMAKYPDDKATAAVELNKALQAVRVDIYK